MFSSVDREANVLLLGPWVHELSNLRLSFLNWLFIPSKAYSLDVWAQLSWCSLHLATPRAHLLLLIIIIIVIGEDFGSNQDSLGRCRWRIIIEEDLGYQGLMSSSSFMIMIMIIIKGALDCQCLMAVVQGINGPSSSLSKGLLIKVWWLH